MPLAQNMGPVVQGAQTPRHMRPLGAGLGLSIVKRICELHDAELRLDANEDGRGLRVTVLW